jgi:hypothetical protein
MKVTEVREGNNVAQYLMLEVVEYWCKKHFTSMTFLAAPFENINSA